MRTGLASKDTFRRISFFADAVRSAGNLDPTLGWAGSGSGGLTWDDRPVAGADLPANVCPGGSS